MGGNDYFDKHGVPYELTESSKERLYDKLEEARWEHETLLLKLERFSEYLYDLEERSVDDPKALEYIQRISQMFKDNVWP